MRTIESANFFGNNHMLSMQILFRSFTSLIIEVSPTLVGKVILPNPTRLVSMSTGEEVNFGTQPTVPLEAERLRQANAINGLFPRFHDISSWTDDTGVTHEMIVMERLEIIHYRHFDRPRREEMLAALSKGIQELHDAYFAHGDLLRPTHIYTRRHYEWMFANIPQTPTGLRLLDTGFSKSLTGNISNTAREFGHCLFQDREDLAGFSHYYRELPESKDAEV